MEERGGRYNPKIITRKLCKKHLQFEIESSRIIEHHKSAGKTRSSKVKTLKKRSKKWLTKRTPIAILNKLSRETIANSKAPKNGITAGKKGRSTLKTI